MPFPDAIEWRAIEWRAIDRPDAASPERVLAWLAAERDALGARLADSGALLLRGLPLRGAEDFDAFVAAFSDVFGLRDYSYAESLSNAVRVELTPRVFTANEAPSSERIELHHELAQTPHSPTHLFFRCERPADRGGETTLCDSAALYAALCERRPAFARACERRGLRYTTRMPPRDDPGSGQGRSWRSTFGVADEPSAEAALRALDYRWRWLPDGALLATSPALPAVAPAPGGRDAFFNQLIAAWLGWRRRAAGDPPVAFGDGGALDPGDVEAAIGLAGGFSTDVAWRGGDVACLDNRRVMHGRRPFEGERRIWAAFATAS